MDWAQAASGTTKLHESGARLQHYPLCCTSASPRLTSMISYSNSLQPVVRGGKILGLVYRMVSLIRWYELKRRFLLDYVFIQG